MSLTTISKMPVIKSHREALIPPDPVDIKYLSIRMPTQLHRALKKKAREEKRSLQEYVNKVLARQVGVRFKM